jgi:hypothetical protein
MVTATESFNFFDLFALSISVRRRTSVSRMNRELNDMKNLIFLPLRKDFADSEDTDPRRSHPGLLH